MDFNSFLSYLASVTVRSLGLAVLALMAVVLFRVRAAAALHAVCTVVVAGMLVLAALAPALPSLPLRILRPEAGPVLDMPIPPALESAVVNARPSQPAPLTHPRFSWQPVAVVAYGAGVLAFLIRLAFGYLFTRRLVRASRAVDCPWATEVYESGWISVPMTVGWLRPRILLPLGWDEWNAAKLQAVMAHERTHVRRADWAIAVLAGLNRCVFWFHPLAWWLERRLAFLAEQACDDSALLLVGTGPYAQALLDMAAAVKAGQGRLVWEAMAMANVAEVRHRIERILDETRQIPKGLTRSRWAALIVCSLPLIYVASVVQLAPAQEQPGRQDISTPRKSSQPPPAPSPMSESLKSKQQLGPADAAQMEQYLAANPQDLDVRRQLVVYYYDNGIREPRLSHIFWLIANHPESIQAAFTSRGITPRTTALNDASDYTRAAGLWKQQAASHSTEARVLGNAADFLSQPGGDPDEAERLLTAAHGLEPVNPEWRNRLARLYTIAIASTAGDSHNPAWNPAFADHVKLQLENSTDGPLLQTTGRMLAAIAVRPQPGQKLPDGVINLDEHPMLTPVVEMGNRLITRSEQFLTNVPGVLGSVQSGQLFTTARSENAPPPPPFAPLLATVPALITKVDPIYPALARQARISGDVKLNLTIGTDGHVQRLELISGHPLLVNATLDAVKQWVYAPIPSAGTISVDVPFRIDGGNAPVAMTPGQMQAAREQQINGIIGGVPGGVATGVVGGVPGGGAVGGVFGSIASNPTPSRIKIGSNVQAAKLVSKVDPVYPEQARAAGIDGDVQLEVVIGPDGHVQSADPKDGNPILATAAAEAVKQWIYQPTHLNGDPIAVITTVTVPFKLQ
jgi:TonB family protein